MVDVILQYNFIDPQEKNGWFSGSPPSETWESDENF